MKKKQTIKMTIPTKSKIKITDKTVGSNLGILLVNDEDINNIRKNTGSLAKQNEYQVHYWSLIIRFKYADNSFMDLSIPTVFYNYKQEVSSGRIDFNLNDTDDTSKQLEPLHNSKVNELLESKSFLNMVEIIKNKYNFKNYEFLSNHLQSIHKHPCDSVSRRYDSFTGTDYDKNPDNPGIIFPFGSIKENRLEPSFASIIHNSRSGAYIAHSEYRTVSMKDNNIVYEKQKCLTYAYKENHEISMLSKMLGNEETLEAYKLDDEITDDEEQTLNISNILYDFMKQSKFKADIDFILKDNVSEKVYASTVFKSKINGLFEFPINKTKIKNALPTRNSKEWKVLYDYAETIYEIKLLDYNIINKMSQDNKNVYYEKLYFELNSEKVKATNVQNLDIMKLQNEFAEFIYDEMKFYNDDDKLDDEAFIQEMEASYQGTKLKGE